MMGKGQLRSVSGTDGSGYLRSRYQQVFRSSSVNRSKLQHVPIFPTLRELVECMGYGVSEVT